MSKIPTDAQWADLASKINGKQDVLDYTTTEQDTGTKWIDGRTIYRKTIDWGTGPNATRVDRTGQFPNNALVIDIKCIIVGANYTTHTVPYINSSGAGVETIFVSNGTNGTLSFATTQDRRSWNIYATIWYCKSS